MDQIAKAVELLNKNDIVGMPTETVYGLAARIDSEVALKKIFSIKQRPFFDPLIVHVDSISQAKSCVDEWPMIADELAQKFWPGPLTLILPKSKRISDLITSGLSNVGVRSPNHPVALELIQKVGCPLAAPSANKFGKTSPTKAQHVKDEFGSDVFVLEGDSSHYGIESTVLLIAKTKDSFDLTILRKGSLLQSEINQHLLSTSISFRWVDSVDKKSSPGQLKHHYMPNVPLVICRNPHRKLSEVSVMVDEKLKELPDTVEGVQIIKPKRKIQKIEFLKLSDDPTQAARELYSQLRSVSQRDPDILCFIQLPHHQGELWESIFDRLYKAASLVLD